MVDRVQCRKIRLNLNMVAVWGIMACLCVLPGCAWWSLDKHIAERAEKLTRQLEAEPRWGMLPRREIAWSEAIKIMDRDNLSLKEARQSLRQAEHSQIRVFTQIIPGVNLDWMLTQDLKRVGNINARDVEYNTNILFNMPSLTQIPFDYYAAKASVYTAKKSYELKQRELLSRLYRQVALYENAIQSHQNSLRNIRYNDDGLQRQKVMEDWQDKQRDISQGFADLLGNIDAQWYVKPSTCPKVNWPAYKKASAHLDTLIVTMMAMELEASRLRMMDVKMRFFPELDVEFYSPSLFTGSGGTYGGFFAGSGDMKINMSLREQLDTRLDVWFDYKTARENYRMLQQRMRIRLLERRDKVAMLMKSRQLFESWKKAKMDEIRFIESRKPKSVDDYLECRNILKKNYEELEAKAGGNVDVEASLILEYGLL